MSIWTQPCYCRGHTLHLYKITRVLISVIADFNDKHPRKVRVHQPEFPLEGLRDILFSWANVTVSIFSLWKTPRGFESISVYRSVALPCVKYFCGWSQQSHTGRSSHWDTEHCLQIWPSKGAHASESKQIWPLLTKAGHALCIPFLDVVLEVICFCWRLCPAVPGTDHAQATPRKGILWAFFLLFLASWYCLF